MEFEQAFCDEIRENLRDIKDHINVLNSEGGQMRDRLGSIESTVDILKDSFFKGIMIVIAMEVFLKVIK